MRKVDRSQVNFKQVTVTEQLFANSWRNCSL